MIKKIIQYAQNLSKRQREIQKHLTKIEGLENEIIWANVFHDSIRGIDYLEKLPLNIGKWAGNYAFFYVLHRVLSDYQPKRIIEFGLGESSKFISNYLANKLLSSEHTIVEHDELWKSKFEKSFQLNNRTSLNILPLVQKNINGFMVNSYEDLDKKINSKFDLYVVDGPFGSERFSRYDIISLLKSLEEGDDFVIIFDDCDRLGEKDTLNDVYELLKEKNVPYLTGEYKSNKTVTLITTPAYKFLTSL